MAIKPASIRRFHERLQFGARLILWPIAILTLVALTLQLGLWRKEYKFAGPFTAETSPPGAALVLNLPPDPPAQWWRQPLHGDAELLINGNRMGPPQTSPDTIRTGETTGFSHWDAQVIFSLPPEFKNGPETTAMFSYSVRPRIRVSATLAALSALLVLFIYFPRLKPLLSRARVPATAFALRAPYLVSTLLCWIGLAASVVYAASSIYAWLAGWALPTTALLRWSTAAEWAARNEPYFAYPLLIIAGLGAATTWLLGASAHRQPLLESSERSLRRALAWCGFPIAVSALLLCTSSMWAGFLRHGDPNYSNIGGLVPFSDAANYFAAVFDQRKDGVWNAATLRRPLAASFRSVVLLLGDFSLQCMLILQAALVAGATCFAANAIMMWRGVWAAIAFFALTYIYGRYFVPTTLTEPLGLVWTLLSIPYFIRAFGDRSANAALVAFAMTVTALMTRMGSMFTIPALLVWLVWQFGNDAKAKLRIGATAVCIVLGIFGTNSLLQRAYGDARSAATGNFSYVLCGLSLGTGWEGCPKKLAAEGTPLSRSEDAAIQQLYAEAWKNLRADTTPFFQRLVDNVDDFRTKFPEVLWRGYGKVEEPDWLPRLVLTTLSLIGLCYGATRIAGVELSFWALLWASILASSSIIYFDDGGRAFAASQPMMALFFALGLSIRKSEPPERSVRARPARSGLVLLIVAAALFICLPWITHRFSLSNALVNNAPLAKPNEAFVFGGRQMSGFLVVENGAPLRFDIPSLHLADFEAIIATTGVEQYQDLLRPASPPLPFGFVFAPRAEKGVESSHLYIVSAEVLERRDVRAWHFYLKKWGDLRNVYNFEYWQYVTRAEPWRPSENR
jgi:hypothetical protein